MDAFRLCGIIGINSSTLAAIFLEEIEFLRGVLGIILLVTTIAFTIYHTIYIKKKIRDIDEHENNS